MIRRAAPRARLRANLRSKDVHVAESTSPGVDPLAMWRDWVAQSERQWNGFLNNAMATDEFSKSLGGMMDVYLNMQKSMNEVMGRYFSGMNMPTRDDVLGIGDRLRAIEERLTSIESLLAKARTAGSEVGSQTPPAAVSGRPRPPRTKKPAKS
jgi:polyhydroxyalkanoic acid synthase PhaR subunit